MITGNIFITLELSELGFSKLKSTFANNFNTFCRNN